MKVVVHYFAVARERARVDREELELPDAATVSDVTLAASTRHPDLAPLLPVLRVAVNREFAPLDARLAPGDEVAIIPPVAGGAGRFVVTVSPLFLSEVIAAVEGPGLGGVVTFTGAVRDHSRGRRVRRLLYEAYVPMAETKLESLGSEVAARWPGCRIAIHHRIGTLAPGEAAVVIAAAAPHRKEAFRACEHAIDRLKEDVPIWKKELYDDGEEWVGLGP